MLNHHEQMKCRLLLDFIFVIGVQRATAMRLLERIDADSTLKTCIANLTRLTFTERDYIFYTHSPRSDAPSLDDVPHLVQVSSLGSYPGRVTPDDLVTYTGYLIVTHVEDLDLHLARLAAMDTWNARGKYLIILRGRVAPKVWVALNRAFIVNVLVLQLDDLQLFTYFPYAYENLHRPNLEPVPLGACDDFDVVRAALGPPQVARVPKQWRNTTINVSFMFLDPYVIDPEAGKGVEIVLVSLMQTYMKYAVNYSTILYKDWGFYKGNRSYTGPLHVLQNNEADFLIGHFHLREPERIIDFDPTFPYMDDDICWAVPKALARSHWQNIVHIFNDDVWWMTVLALFLSYVAWQIFALISPGWRAIARRYYSNPFASMEVPFVMFLGLPILYEPQNASGRCLALAISVFCFILVTGWKSYLIDSLTHDIFDAEMRTLSDIIKGGLIIGLYPELIDMNCAQGTPDGDYVCKYADRNLCDASFRCLDRAAYKRDIATISTRRIMRYSAPQRYRTTNGRSLIYVQEKFLEKDYTVQYYTKGHPLFERSNDLLLWVRTSGFALNIDNRLNHEVELGFQEFVSSLARFEISTLGLTQLEGMFFMLLGGLSLSILTFLLEIVAYRHRHRLAAYYTSFKDGIIQFLRFNELQQPSTY